MNTSETSDRRETVPTHESASKGHIALWVILAALILVNYTWTFHDIVRAWIEREQLTLGLVILAAALYLIWDRRHEFTAESIKPTRWGLAFVVFSFLLLFIGTRAGLVLAAGISGVFLRGVSLVVCLCGLFIFLFGWQAMKPFWLPAILLLFIYPENYFTAYWVPLRLQTLAVVISEKVVALLGNVVVREGHVLETPGFSANVVEACSGIRSLMTVVPTAIFIGAYGLRRPATRLALVLLAIPMTILANVFRVSISIILGIYVSPKAAEGFFHYFAGMGIFAVALIGLLLLLKLLRMAEGPDKDDSESSDADVESEGYKPSKTSISMPPLRPSAIAIFAIIILRLIYQALEINRLRANTRKYAHSSIENIPVRIGKWRGKNLHLDEEVIRFRSPCQWLFRTYEAPGEPPIEVLVFYWKPNSGGILERRDHNPEGCGIYHGMKLKWKKEAEVRPSSADLPAVKVNVNALEGPMGTILITWWQQEGFQPPKEFDGPKTYLGRAIFGLKTIFWPQDSKGPELAFQLVTRLGASPERIMSAHAGFASLFIPEIANAAALGSIADKEHGAETIPD